MPELSEVPEAETEVRTMARFELTLESPALKEQAIIAREDDLDVEDAWGALWAVLEKHALLAWRASPLHALHAKDVAEDMREAVQGSIQLRRMPLDVTVEGSFDSSPLLVLLVCVRDEVTFSFSSDLLRSTRVAQSRLHNTRQK